MKLIHRLLCLGIFSVGTAFSASADKNDNAVYNLYKTISTINSAIESNDTTMLAQSLDNVIVRFRDRKDTIWALDKDRLANTTSVEDTIIVTVFDGIDNHIQNKYSGSELFIRAFEKTFYVVGGCASYTAILRFYAEDFYGAINAAKAILEYNPNSAFAQSVLM